MASIRTPYLRVLGIHVEMSGPGRAEFAQFTPEEEREFQYEITIFSLLSLCFQKNCKTSRCL